MHWSIVYGWCSCVELGIGFDYLGNHFYEDIHHQWSIKIYYFATDMCSRILGSIHPISNCFPTNNHWVSCTISGPGCSSIWTWAARLPTPHEFFSTSIVISMRTTAKYSPRAKKSQPHYNFWQQNGWWSWKFDVGAFGTRDFFSPFSGKKSA